ncbi:MAG: hypothetical protein HY960_02905 [Ignavibacteriae bacterium]|nr:hypothetical protein [Ignavibacteriota bacterium]
MTFEEVKKSIRDTTLTLRSYRQINEKKTSSLNFEQFNKEADEAIIKELIKELIRESYMLGPSGKPCPTCGGTGRI